jgi:hypothetical protein
LKKANARRERARQRLLIRRQYLPLLWLELRAKHRHL